MVFGERDQPIQAFSSNRTDQALTSAVRLRAARVGDPFLTPAWVLRSHAPNQTLKIGRNRGAARSGLVAPEQPPSRPMPANHRLRAHNGHAGSPVAQPRPNGQAKACCRVDAGRLHARSAKSAICRRRMRFSAAMARRGLRRSAANRLSSASSPRRTRASKITKP